MVVKGYLVILKAKHRAFVSLKVVAKDRSAWKLARK